MSLPLVAQTLDTTCGPACFESMVRHFFGQSPGELHFAKELGVLTLGYTPVDNVVNLARKWGLKSQLFKNSTLNELRTKCSESGIVFVTWWYEDSGHYSLIEEIRDDQIILMDPWIAREGEYHQLPITHFEPNWRARGATAIVVDRLSRA